MAIGQQDNAYNTKKLYVGNQYIAGTITAKQID